MLGVSPPPPRHFYSTQDLSSGRICGKFRKSFIIFQTFYGNYGHAIVSLYSSHGSMFPFPHHQLLSLTNLTLSLSFSFVNSWQLIEFPALFLSLSLPPLSTLNIYPLYNSSSFLMYVRTWIAHRANVARAKRPTNWPVQRTWMNDDDDDDATSTTVSVTTSDRKQNFYNSTWCY